MLGENHMDLTPEAIDAIAGWQSAYPGFDRNDDLSKTPIQRLLDYFTSSADLDCHILKGGGLSNYAGLFIFSRKDMPVFVYQHVEGLLVYLSLCIRWLSPVTAFVRSAVTVHSVRQAVDPVAFSR